MIFRGELVKVEEGYYLTIITFHASLLIGVFSYASKDVDQNGLFGLRTPGTLTHKTSWKQAHAQVGAIVPLLSSVCCALALAGIWVDALRTVLASLAIIGVQLAVLLGFAVEWWSPPKNSLSLLQQDEDPKDRSKE
jgi:hypothetical protein